MKYVCIWTDPIGTVTATRFEASGDDEAVNGLIDRCRSKINIPKEGLGAKLRVNPALLMREDFSTFMLSVILDDDGNEVLSNLGEMDIDR